MLTREVGAGANARRSNSRQPDRSRCHSGPTSSHSANPRPSAWPRGFSANSEPFPRLARRTAASSPGPTPGPTRPFAKRSRRRFPTTASSPRNASTSFADKEWCWVVDPIDGTTNFARGIPVWATSLGLLYRGTPVFGHVRVPTVRQTFHGYWPGRTGLDMSRGAYCNGEPIRSSAEALSDHQFISLCSRSSRVLRHALPCKVRVLGAATCNLVGVASGAMLGAIEKTPKIWDVAGVWAIVQAAGGIWIDLGRDPQFPLEPGRDYGSPNLSYTALASNDLRPLLEPLVRSAFGDETSPSP